MRKVLNCLCCLFFLAIAANDSYAAERKIKSIDVEKKEDEIRIIFKTSGEPKFIAYDILKPPQIIVDVIENGLTDVEENIPVYFGAVEQIKAVKSSFSEEDYYGVDFWVIQLREPVEYQLSYSDNAYLLTLSKAGIMEAKEEKISGIEITECPSVAVPVAATESEAAVELRQEGYRCQIDGKYRQAVEYYRKAIAQDPYYATAYNDLGIIYYIYLDDIAKAIEEFQKALVIDPYYVGAHTNLALIYENLNEKEKALKHWKERARLGNSQDYWAKLARQKVRELGE